jgi:hypothetical protein
MDGRTQVSFKKKKKNIKWDERSFVGNQHKVPNRSLHNGMPKGYSRVDMTDYPLWPVVLCWMWVHNAKHIHPIV